jgi:hypothetical protein
MRVPIRPAAAAFLAILIAVAWLGSSVSARAGGSGAASGSATALLNMTCMMFGVTNCPTLQTMNQTIIETAALSGQTPAVIRGPLNLNLMPPPAVFDAGTLTGLTNPLAFIALPGQPPTPTSSGDLLANSSLTATTNGALTALNLKFDYLPLTNPNFTTNQDVGDITFSAAVADDNMGHVVRDVMATLQIRGTGNGSGVTTDIMGNLTGMGSQTYQLAQLGMTSSLNFTNGFFEFDLGIPLLVPADFLNPVPPGPAYLFSAPGFEFDLADHLFDGINPVASFLDASFEDNAGNLLGAAHADLAIAFDGSTIISDPVPTPEPSALALLGSGLLGLVFLRRRRRVRRVDPAA